MLERSHIEAQLIGPAVQVRVRTASIGEAEAEQLVNEVCEAMGALGPRAVIDFAAVEAIASAGLAALVRIHNHAKAHNGAVAFYNCSKNLTEGFKLTRLHKLFKIAKDDAAAVKAVT